jgi:hypothetical protein
MMLVGDDETIHLEALATARSAAAGGSRLNGISDNENLISNIYLITKMLSFASSPDSKAE